MLEIGDSLGNDLGWGLERRLKWNTSIVLVQRDKSSTGLSNSWFYNWQSHLEQYLHAYHPHLVMVCIGGNDARDVNVDGHFAAFGSRAWTSFYDRMILQVETADYAAGARTLWVGLPIMQPLFYRSEVVRLDAQYVKVTKTVPGATYLSTWSLFADARGQFRHAGYVNHSWQVLRSPDGIHLSSAGENVLSTFVAQEIGLIYHVTIRPAQPVFITG